MLRDQLPTDSGGRPEEMTDDARMSAERGKMRDVGDSLIDLMHRPVYGMAEVDALCGLHSGTAKRWIDGYSRGGRDYQPVVRRERTGSEVVTWGEFVEVRLLGQYRNASVPMQHIRPVVVQLRHELNVDFPLAVAQQWLEPEGKELVRRIQDESKLPKGLRLVQVLRTGQLALAPEVARFVDQAELADDRLRSVVRFHPGVHVVIDPLRQSGTPTVRGVPTEVIVEQFRAGADPTEIGDEFNLTPEQVLDALRFESPLSIVSPRCFPTRSPHWPRSSCAR